MSNKYAKTGFVAGSVASVDRDTAKRKDEMADVMMLLTFENSRR
jgi:hypothetical protein